MRIAIALGLEFTLRPLADLEKRCVEHQKRFAAGWPRAVILPGLPQTRTCIFDAYGSSGHGLAAR